MKKIKFEGLQQLPFEEWELGAEQRVKRTPASHYAAEVEEQAKPADPTSRLLYYQSFGSGSSGNSCYIGTRRGGIIVDAGVKHDFVEATLRASGVKMESVHGILLTHDHSDHVKYAYQLLRNNKHMKLFCTNRVLNGLLKRHNISRRIKDYHVPIFKEIPFKIYDFDITAFEVPHDGSDNMGFSIEFDSRRFVLATDLGAVTSRARHYMWQADYLVIESNYDLRMLLQGRYPEYLKARIQTEIGHMDNVATARFLTELYGDSSEGSSKRPSHVFLCHLSKDNNTPDLALQASEGALVGCGLKVGRGDNTISDRACDVQLIALPRFDATRLYVFRP